MEIKAAEQKITEISDTLEKLDEIIELVSSFTMDETKQALVASIVANITGVQAPTGMAHDGIDYVPKEGTWLLDKGERVLSPRQNADFTRAMNERQSNAKAEPVQQPQVNVRVINNLDQSEFFDAMATPTGEKIVMNIIKRNRTKLRI